MNFTKLSALVLSAGLALGATGTSAQMMNDHKGMDHSKMGHDMKGHGMHMNMHGPIGVMGRHVMPKGKFMLTYRFGHMSMSGLRSGTTDLNPNTVATTVPNRYFGNPGQPPTLRVIPDSMTMDMHMFGAMYGLNDDVTLMAMLPYIEKEMTAVTYRGPAGAAVLGTSKRKSEGIGDVRVGATFKLLDQGPIKLNGTLALSLPTGSITETGQMLTPMGMRPTGRLAYPMQLGSGTYDLHPALTYQSHKGPLAWGAQLRGSIRLGSNDEGYSLGDEYALTAWTSYRAAPWLSLSGRIEAQTIDSIDGRDLLIGGPAPGADPLNIGGDFVTVFAGADLTPKRGALKGHKIGLEVGVPVYQKLNGPMTKRDWSVAVAWRKSF